MAIKNNIDLNKKLDKEKALYKYDEQQKIYYLDNLKTNLKLVKINLSELNQLVKFDPKNSVFVAKILELVPSLENKDLKELDYTIKKMISLANQLNHPKEEIIKKISIPANIPYEIMPEIKADIEELNRCFNNECYRSSIILCGRLLETALHRKYYDATKNDLLEKSPGIGLGNILAKLREKNINLDPGLTNEIHLINQVRIFSVHKKQEAFYPSKQQTQATILYTLDVLEKLF